MGRPLSGHPERLPGRAEGYRLHGPAADDQLSKRRARLMAAIHRARLRRDTLNLVTPEKRPILSRVIHGHEPVTLQCLDSGGKEAWFYRQASG